MAHCMIKNELLLLYTSSPQARFSGIEKKFGFVTNRAFEKSCFGRIGQTINGPFNERYTMTTVTDEILTGTVLAQTDEEESEEEEEEEEEE